MNKYIFTILNENEFKEYYDNSIYSSFLQSVELGNLKKCYGDIIHYVGIKENNFIIAASLLLESKVIFGKSIFYAPRGFMLDYTNKELLDFMTINIKRYIKNNKGFVLNIDPNVIYRKRNSDGSIMDNDVHNDLVINNLINSGYKHFGFNIYFDTMQGRWCYILPLDMPYDDKFNTFSKSAKKNIIKTYEMGLETRKATYEDLDVMVDIFKNTGDRKEFITRGINYYHNMWNTMKNLLHIYISHINTDKFLEYVNKEISIAKNNLDEINNKMAKEIVGKKLTNDKEICLKHLDKLNKELERAKELKNAYPEGKDIAALLSLKSGNELLSLSSGSLPEFREFTPKYQMYDCHIKDAYKEGFKYCNFYGISGNFDKNSKYYGIYEIKKEFNGYVIEYIGQFELEISKFNKIYKIMKKIKHLF